MISAGAVEPVAQAPSTGHKTFYVVLSILQIGSGSACGFDDGPSTLSRNAASTFKYALHPFRQVEDPYRFLAVQGTLDMIESAPDKVLPVIPQVPTSPVIVGSTFDVLKLDFFAFVSRQHAHPAAKHQLLIWEESNAPQLEGVLVFAMCRTCVTRHRLYDLVYRCVGLVGVCAHIRQLPRSTPLTVSTPRS